MAFSVKLFVSYPTNKLLTEIIVSVLATSYLK